MEFSIVGALVAGFVATAVMTAMMKLAGAAGMTQMPPMELITGAMVSGDEAMAKQLGYFLHWIMMGTIVFGLVYAAIFSAAGSASWLLGLGAGLAHGVLVGVSLAMMPAMHPRISGAPSAAGPVSTINGEVHLSAPGVFGAAWGGMTPVGLLIGHAVYGIVLALVYQLFV
jgi:hypothetical protein